MTDVTITVTELAHRCGISESAARNRLRRFKAGLTSRDELLHQGPMRSGRCAAPAQVAHQPTRMIVSWR